MRVVPSGMAMTSPAGVIAFEISNEGALARVGQRMYSIFE